MNAITLLRAQHAELDAMLVRATITPSPGLILAIGDRFEAHAVIEETLLYTTFATGATRAALDDYARDHQRIRAALAFLCDERFRATPEMIVAARDHFYQHAIGDEEVELFPRVDRTLTASQLDQLGTEMHALYTEILQRAPWRTLGPDARRAAPL